MDFPLSENDQPIEEQIVDHALDLLDGKLVELPDGTEAVLLGNPDRSKDYFHKQGDNSYGFEGTCGLTSCGDVLNQFGFDVTEDDVVRHAAHHHECLVIPFFPEMSGGTTAADQAHILTDFRVPAHVETDMSLERLAESLADHHGAIIEVNAGELWDDSAYYDFGQANHAVTVTGVAVNPASGNVEGIWINDSGRGDFARYLPAEHAAVQGWLNNGGLSVVTDLGYD